MSDTYARGDTYAQENAYGRDDGYAQGYEYAQDDGYGQGDAYGQGEAYGRDDEFARARAQRPPRLSAYDREQQYVGLKTRERRDGKERTGASGGLILAFVALFSIAVIIVGLAYAQGDGARRRVLLAEGDCAPVASLNQTGLDCTTESQLWYSYRQMIAPMNQQMKTFVPAYAASELHNLPAAKGVLTGELGVENSLDGNLKQFTFPPVFSSATNKLIADNEALIKLTTKQAQSSALVQLRSFDSRVQAAQNTVRADLKLVSRDLEKNPTPNEFIGNGG